MIRALFSLYSPHYPSVLVAALQRFDRRPLRYLAWFWHTQDFSRSAQHNHQPRSRMGQLLVLLLSLGIAVQLALGIGLLIVWDMYRQAGYWGFGLALLLSYPIVWAHVLAIVAMALAGPRWPLVRLKRVGRHLICLMLEHQVRQLRKRHAFTIVAVTGSVGKTSTKAAIARVLASQKRVIYQEGNYNDRLTVPLVLFGQSHPGLFNVAAWAKVFIRNQQMIHKPYPYDIAVLELGSDGPGQIEEFAYVRPDLAVVTAVAPEHMEYFGTLDAVATEELSVAQFSKQTLINGDDVAAEYQQGLPEYRSYGLVADNTYRASYHQGETLDGEQVTFMLPGERRVEAHIAYLGNSGVKIALCALAVADMLGLDLANIAEAVESLRPFPGRMQILQGKNGSVIIDDTYNASPLAVKAALDALYVIKAPKRIAILGSMNELGATTADAHTEVGAYCDPDKLAIVATLGTQANKYLAPAARARGCEVVEFTSPYDVGEWALQQLDKDVVLLAKGSQNGVFAEEALKALLQSPEDQKKLVRQSPYWLKVKRGQFSSRNPAR